VTWVGAAYLTCSRWRLRPRAGSVWVGPIRGDGSRLCTGSRERHPRAADYAHGVTTVRRVALGMVLGAIAALTYHFTSTTIHPTGWFAYAPLTGSITFKTHPAWGPTAIVAPALGALIGFGRSQLPRRRHCV
jgi:hypothetical protein